jgi:O-antigen/teichoic acid export membrane protein
MPVPEAPASEDPRDVLDTPAAGRLLIRGSALRFAGYAAMLGLSAVMAAVLTRHLGVAEFGLYTTVMSVVAVVAAVTDAGMANIGTREYAVLHGSEREELMSNLLALRIVLTLGGIVLTTGFAVAAGYDRPLVLGAVTASLATIPLVIQHTLSIPLQTGLRLGVVAALELLRQTLWVLGVVVLSALGAGVFPLLSILLVVNLLLIFPTARLVRGDISTRFVVRPRAWPPLLRITVVYSLATAVGTVYAYTAQILTSLVTSRHQSGLFAVSFRVFIVAVTVPALLASAALPVLARAGTTNEDRFAYGVRRMFDILLLAGVGAAVVISAASGFIVAVIGGPSYHGSGPVLAIQAFGLIGSFLAAGWSFALLSLRLHRRLLVTNVAALAVSIALTLTLAHAEGAHGAAIATVCGEAVLALGAGLGLMWGRPRYRPQLQFVIKVCLGGAAAGLASLVPTMPSVVRAVVAGLVYCLLLVALRAVPPELRELLPRTAAGSTSRRR